MRLKASLFMLSVLVASCSFQPTVVSRSSDIHPQVEQGQQPPIQWLEFSTPSHQNNWGFASIAIGPGHTLWFTYEQAPGLAEVDMSGGIREFNTGVVPTSIAEGQDTKMWFTAGANGLGEIYRIDANGLVAKYPMQAQPYSIVSGADGRLWFSLTSSQGMSIGAITVYGVVSTYPLLQQNESAGGLTQGPDNNIWFTFDIGQDAYLGKMTPQGQETDYLVGSGFFVRSLATGSDGNIWFAEFNPTGQSGIGRVNSDGSNAVFFPTVEPPSQIVRGQRGSMWFMAAASDLSSWEVDQISENGNVSRNPAPSTDKYLNNLAFGPDGNLWIPDPFNSAIDVFVRRLLTVTPTSFSLMVGKSGVLSVNETGYSGKFKASGCPPSIASISPNGPDAFKVPPMGPVTAQSQFAIQRLTQR